MRVYATCRAALRPCGQATQALPWLQRGFASGDLRCDAKNTLIRILSDVRCRITLQTGALYETAKYQ